MKRETDRKVLGVFRALLGLPEPWRMVAVEIKDEEKLVEIEVEWPERTKVGCPAPLHPLESLVYKQGSVIVVTREVSLSLQAEQPKPHNRRFKPNHTLAREPRRELGDVASCAFKGSRPRR